MYKILLVEDVLILGETIIDISENAGYEATWVKDGQAALEKTFDNNYDLFLFDVNVPFINGFELLKELRQSGNITPAIFITARVDMDSLSNGFDEIESFKELILPSLFGFAQTLELSKIYNTEFALLKLFFEKGIFAFSVLMLIFINPLYKCFKNKNILSISSVFLPSLMFFGGLLHYGVSFKSELILLNLLLFSYIRNTNEE